MKLRDTVRVLRDDKGVAILEFALVLPVFLLLFGLMMTVGRLWIVRADILAVARDAARQAAIQPDAASAASAAITAGSTAASDYSLNSAQLTISPQGPFGPGDTYHVEASYRVDLSDLSGLGVLPSMVTLRATAAEPIDTFTTR
jgi:hypothetical protein